MSLTEKQTKRLMIATTDAEVGNGIADEINAGSSLAALTSHVLVAAIVATNVSQTIDFGALEVGDRVVVIPSVPNVPSDAHFVTVATAGTLGEAAVVGNLYLVLRARVAPAASEVKF